MSSSQFPKSKFSHITSRNNMITYYYLRSLEVIICSSSPVYFLVGTPSRRLSLPKQPTLEGQVFKRDRGLLLLLTKRLIERLAPPTRQASNSRGLLLTKRGSSRLLKPLTRQQLASAAETVSCSARSPARSPSSSFGEYIISNISITFGPAGL